MEKEKKLYGPFLWTGFNCLKARANSRGQFTFYHEVPRNFWYSFYQPRKNERLSRPWSHSVVLNMGPLDWETDIVLIKSYHGFCSGLWSVNWILWHCSFLSNYFCVQDSYYLNYFLLKNLWKEKREKQPFHACHGVTFVTF